MQPHSGNPRPTRTYTFLPPPNYNHLLGGLPIERSSTGLIFFLPALEISSNIAKSHKISHAVWQLKPEKRT